MNVVAHVDADFFRNRAQYEDHLRVPLLTQQIDLQVGGDFFVR
jgi:hypothetical protein